MSYPIQEAVLLGLTTLGLVAADRVVVNAGNFTLKPTITVEKSFVAPPGNTNPINVLTTVQGDASHTSDVRMQREIISAQGTNGFKDVRNRYAGTNLHHQPGATVQHTYTDHLYVTVTGGGHLNYGRAHYAHYGVSNGSTVSHARVYEAGDLIIANGGTVDTSTGLRVANIGHESAVRAAVGVQVANFNATQYAVGVEVNTLAGPGKWGYRATGDANHALNGKTRFGGLHAPQYPVDVTGDAQVTGAYRFANGVTFSSGPGTPPAPAAKGSMYLSTDFGPYENRDGGMGWVSLRKAS
jgi:hypothetical protein